MGLNGEFKIVTATQYITRIKDSTKNQMDSYTHTSFTMVTPCQYYMAVIQLIS